MALYIRMTRIAQVCKQHHMFALSAVPASGVPKVCVVRSITLAMYTQYITPTTACTSGRNNLRTTGRFGSCVLLS
jgi:hypothetical protein